MRVIKFFKKTTWQKIKKCPTCFYQVRIEIWKIRMKKNALLKCSFIFRRFYYIWLDFFSFVVFSFFGFQFLLAMSNLCMFFLNKYEKIKQNQHMDRWNHGFMDGSKLGVSSNHYGYERYNHDNYCQLWRTEFCRTKKIFKKIRRT